MAQLQKGLHENMFHSQNWSGKSQAILIVMEAGHPVPSITFVKAASSLKIFCKIKGHLGFPSKVILF